MVGRSTTTRCPAHLIFLEGDFAAILGLNTLHKQHGEDQCLRHLQSGSRATSPASAPKALQYLDNCCDLIVTKFANGYACNNMVDGQTSYRFGSNEKTCTALLPLRQFKYLLCSNLNVSRSLFKAAGAYSVVAACLSALPAVRKCSRMIAVAAGVLSAADTLFRQAVAMLQISKA